MLDSNRFSLLAKKEGVQAWRNARALWNRVKFYWTAVVSNRSFSRDTSENWTEPGFHAMIGIAAAAEKSLLPLTLVVINDGLLDWLLGHGLLRVHH